MAMGPRKIPTAPNAVMPPRTPKKPSRNGTRTAPRRNHERMMLSTMLTATTPHASSSPPAVSRPSSRSQTLAET